MAKGCKLLTENETVERQIVADLEVLVDDAGELWMRLYSVLQRLKQAHHAHEMVPTRKDANASHETC